MEAAPVEAAQALHRDALVVDAHADTVLDIINGRPLGRRSRRGHVDLPRLRDGGVKVQVFAHYIQGEYKPDRALPRFLELLDAFLTEVDANASHITVVKTVAQLEEAVSQGKIAAVLAIEGGEALAGRLAVLRIFHRLGVRLIGLTWNERNDLADGVGESGTGGGLSRLGVAVVQEMNRLGMVVDVSHLSDAGFWHVMEVSSRPVVASHSNCRALCNHPRNLSDEQIKALARNGGVMGMNFYPPFVDEDPRQATIDRIVDHMEHIVQLVGPDHVGLGSDFDGIDSTPIDLEDVSKLPRLTEAMVRRGFSDADIRKILGENFLRVFRQVWGG
ncbi:MAG TPA: dipeptidase [Sphingobacteriaceae bacterium]|nr:dipeptidase [Sphingobacteriaceae bacterium]